MNDDFASLYAYNEWANARTIETLRGVPVDAYTREQGGGWPSLRTAMVHIAGATDAWAERLAGRDAVRLPTESDLPALEDAVAVLTAAQKKLRAHLATLSPERLATPFAWKNPKGETRTAPYWAVLRHVVNHSTYHRGQISSMVRRLGLKPLATDMVVWGIEIQKSAR